LTNDNIGAICQDYKKNIWIGTEQGINIIDNNLNLIKTIEQDATDQSNLSDNAIYSIFNDNNNNIWIGTFFGGVNIFYQGSDNFTIYPYGYRDNDLSGKAVRQIIANDQNTLWIATEDGGLNFLDKRTGKIQHYQNNNSKIRLSYHNIHSLLKDRNNNLWIGTFTGGINCYNIISGRMKYYSPTHNNLPSNTVFSLLQDKKGDIWAGTTTGLMQYIPEENQFVRFNDNQVNKQFIYCLFQDSQENIWIGTRSNGLFLLDHRTNKVKSIKLSIPTENFITSINEDRKKQLWIGTNSSGVICLNKNTEIMHLGIKDGLISNSIKGIIEDNNGKIWFSTESGLCRFDQTSKEIENFAVNDGLPINQFNFSSAFKDQDGELFFGTINGMISFYPSQLISENKQFKVQLTNFKISGKTVEVDSDRSPLIQNISETNSLELTHSQASSFSFDFTGLNFKYASNTIYAMRLLGADSDWQTINKQRQILFSNLPEGKYELQIKASIDGTHWDEEGMRTLKIRVLPPLWKSWWAMIIYFILLFFAALATLRIIHARLTLRMSLQTEHAEKLQLEELNRHKINFFTFITHDLKTPLTLVLSPLQRLINSKNITPEIKKKMEVIYKNANRMNHLIDEIMTFSKIEMKQLKIAVDQGDVLAFIHEISSIFEMIAIEREIDFVIDIDQTARDNVWFSPSNVERIIYNLLSNAFKYTPKGGMITLAASIEHRSYQTFLNILVEDTGRGIPNELLEKIFENYYQVNPKDASEGTGIGLALTKMLVNIHKGTIKAESNSGTRFIVHLNVSESAFEDDEKSERILDIASLNTNKSNFVDSVKLFSESIPVKEYEHNTRQKILIVEDNPEMNEYLEEIFAQNFDIVKSFNGKDGLEKAASENPDIIVSDIMMPVMDGLELTAQLKSNLSFSHIPVILLTAKTMENDFTKGYHSGADAYIVKPFNAENLELLVNNLLQTRQRNIERFKTDENTSIQEIVSNPRDEKFMLDLVNLIMENLEDEDFGVSEITSAMAVSRSLLHIKLKKLANVSITEFIRQIKIKEAKKLLLRGHNVSETSFAVGFSDPNYFTKCFKKQIGMTPSEFIKKIKNYEQKNNTHEENNV
ncbi:MAG: two-component regulator propeller domain-containing protein, partial [Dysgonomonas sp.]